MVGLYLALLVLIIVGFGMLVGKGVVMGLLLVLGRVPLAPFQTSFCCYFITLPGLLVHCSLVLFLYGIVLLSLPLEPLFGLCLFLAMLLGLLDVVLSFLVFLVHHHNHHNHHDHHNHHTPPGAGHRVVVSSQSV